ncbi:MAG: sigma-70 family RNA polymerase sigma factor [Betaproteobacteria bacterium]|nr:sigma-70 family RNA polymerase sigma factor [Betaproteobacteria bacterium]
MTKLPDSSQSDWMQELSSGKLRKDMLRFAMLQLRDQQLAEDVVQDALLAAFAASEKFEQRSSAKTWIFGILKNKIIDTMRDRWNKGRIDLPEALGSESEFDALFKENNHWQTGESPSAWADPEQALSNNQFWQVLEICMTQMPEAAARVFTMREMLGFETGEICKELGITSSNCWVILHRARMILRLCLQHRWFGEKEEAC